VVLFALSAMVTRLLLPSDLQLVIEIARSRLFPRQTIESALDR
jgi:hypothetical protein